MKTKYLYIIYALTLGLVACQQGSYEAELASNGQINFNVTAGSTRVVNDVFEEGDKIGIYVTDYTKDAPAALQVSGNRANNEGVVYNGDKWVAERSIYWGEGKSDIYAYYPYINNVTDVDEFPFSIATDQDAEGAYEASDLLWAKAEGVAESDGAVQLEMKHTMSRLVVRIMAGEDYKGSLPKDATVHLHSTVTDVLFSFDNGSVVKDPYASAKSIKMHNRGIHTFADGKAVVYEAIVAPQMLLGTVPLLEINSKSVSYLLEDMFNFKPGVSYTYTAVLNTSTTSIKIDIGCTTDDWNNIGGGTGGDSSEGGEGGDESSIDLSLYTDLSATGTANCYLVQATGNYKFKAVKGNSYGTVGNVRKTEVLWETFGTDVMPNEGDLIASTGYQDGYIYFSTAENFNNGNASIAVRNSKDVILWSWHIWCSEEGWIDQVYPNNAGTMMDRNLGATSATPGDVGALGLMYQWGRKDPFLAANSISTNTLAASTGIWSSASSSNQIDFAEEHPMTFATDWINGGILGEGWHLSKEVKGLYDPCPMGYRVPDGAINGFWEAALGTNYNLWNAQNMKWTNSGFTWTLADDTIAWYPATGYRAHSGLYQTGSDGRYWTAYPLPNGSKGAYYLYFSSGSVYTGNYDMSRFYGLPVRCVKE